MSTILDTFATDTIASGDWTAVAGTWLINQTPGEEGALRFSGVVTGFLQNNGPSIGDGRHVLELNRRESGSWDVGWQVCPLFIDINNFVSVRWNAAGGTTFGGFSIHVTESGVGTYHSVISAPQASETNGRWFLVAEKVGNLITAELWKGIDPRRCLPADVPDYATSHVLTGADATKFGAGQTGKLALRASASNDPVGWSIEEFEGGLSGVSRPDYSTQAKSRIGVYVSSKGVTGAQSFETWVGRQLWRVMDFFAEESWDKVEAPTWWFDSGGWGAGSAGDQYKVRMLFALPMLVASNTLGTTNPTRRHTLAITATGGTYTLTYNAQTTASINAADVAATVQTRLEALASVGAGNVTVTGTPTLFTIQFKAAAPASTLTVATGALTGGSATAAAVTVPTLADGAQGSYDIHFTRWANFLVAEGITTCDVRIGWEFNGNWFKWGSITSTGMADFKSYYQRMVNAIRAVPGLTCKFEWCLNVGNAGPAQDVDSERAYPGDAYVDYIAVDVYDQADQGGADATARFKRIRNRPFGLEWARDFARRHNKQLALPEWGLNYTTTPGFTRDNPIFIQGVYDAISGSNVAHHNYWEFAGAQRISTGLNPNSATLFLSIFKPFTFSSSKPTFVAITPRVTAVTSLS